MILGRIIFYIVLQMLVTIETYYTNIIEYFEIKTVRIMYNGCPLYILYVQYSYEINRELQINVLFSYLFG